MQYAIVDGIRQEAQSGLSGICPACERPMVARCGDVRVHHWAHRGRRVCDTWWENETEWHRTWKEMFPQEWREYVQHAEDGEKHIADVKTDDGWVLEFQHSRIQPDERIAREAFYKKMIWIVDGTRRKRDKPQFEKVLQENGRRVPVKLNLFKILFPEESVLLREWSSSRVPVFFDFSGADKTKDVQLWYLIGVVDGTAYVGPFSMAALKKYHSPDSTMDFGELLRNLQEIVALAAKLKLPQRRSPEPLNDFQRYLLRKQRKRRRF